MTVTDPRIERTASGVHVVTLPGGDGARDRHLVIHPRGAVIDAAAAPVTASDVAVVQRELRTVGQAGLADQVGIWWRHHAHV